MTPPAAGVLSPNPWSQGVGIKFELPKPVTQCRRKRYNDYNNI